MTKSEEYELLQLLELENIEKEKEKCRNNVEYFIQNYVYIEDRDADELASLFTLWDKQKEALQGFINNRLNIVLKARQLGLTWLALSYSIWNIIYNMGYQVVALSKTEDDAKELVRRVVFILRHLPPWIIREKTKDTTNFDGLFWTSTTMSVTIHHKDISIFNSFPAGQNSGRSFTANLVIMDEWAFQQWAREIWAAAYPTINRPNGGKVIGLSTAKRLTLFEDIWEMATKGLNTFNRIFLPWSTDPRRTETWYEQTKLDLPHSYKAEYPSTPEEAFEAAEGVAFPEFSRDVHVCKPFPIPKYWRKWRSCDNGYSDPFAWYWFAVSEDGIIYIYQEYTRDKKDDKVNYSDQARQVINLTGDMRASPTVCGHDAWNVHHLTITPATPTGKSLINYYADGGLHDCIRAITDRAIRKTTWHEYLKPYWDDNLKRMMARVQIFDTCEKLIETLPRLVNDEKDNEKVCECELDHWYDGAGYGLIYNHSRKSNEENIDKSKKLADKLGIGKKERKGVL